MQVETAQKKFTLFQTIVACLTSLIISAVGCVVWATSFQTKALASEQNKAMDSRVTKLEEASSVDAYEHEQERKDIARVEGKVDRVLELMVVSPQARKVRR